MKKIFIAFSTIALFLSCGTNKSQFVGTPFERHLTLNGTGFTQSKLDTLTNFIKNNLETTGMLILQDGKVLYEYGNIEEVSYYPLAEKVY